MTLADARELVREHFPVDDDANWEASDLIEAAVTLSLGAPSEFGEIEREVKRSLGGRTAQLWISRITRMRTARIKEQGRDERAAARKAERAALERAGIPSFEVGDAAEIGRVLFNRLQRESDADVVYDHDALHVYRSESGLYEPMNDLVLEDRVNGWSGAMVGDDDKTLAVSASVAKGAVRAAAARATVEHGERFFSTAPDGVAFSDAFVVWDDAAGKLVALQRSALNRQTWGLPYAYDPDARCDRWREFLGEIWQGDEDAEWKAAALQEFVGMCLMGLGGKVAKALVLLGDGANGKSVALHVIKTLFGDAWDNVPPQLFDDGPSTISFAWTRVNLVTEMPEREILESHAVKAIIGGDPVKRRDLYKSAVLFTPKPGHIFATNGLPYAPDGSDGFWRRWMVLKFSRRWDVDGTRPDLPPADPGLGARLVTELPGIACWALQGAARYHRQGRYTTPASSATNVDAWRMDSDRVGQWLVERCVKQDDAGEGVWSPSKTLYDDYRRWCGEGGFGASNVTNWGKRLKKYVKSKRSNGTHYACRIKTMYDEH